MIACIFATKNRHADFSTMNERHVVIRVFGSKILKGNGKQKQTHRLRLFKFLVWFKEHGSYQTPDYL